MAGNHECQQPTNRWEGSGGAPQAPSTPHQTEVASHFACLGWASAAAGVLGEIGSAPCSPRAPGTGAATSRAADGWIAGVAEPERGGGSSEPVLAQGLRMQKHLVFTDKQARARRLLCRSPRTCGPPARPALALRLTQLFVLPAGGEGIQAAPDALLPAWGAESGGAAGAAGSRAGLGCCTKSLIEVPTPTLLCSCR